MRCDPGENVTGKAYVRASDAGATTAPLGRADALLARTHEALAQGDADTARQLLALAEAWDAGAETLRLAVLDVLALPSILKARHRLLILADLCGPDGRLALCRGCRWVVSRHSGSTFPAGRTVPNTLPSEGNQWASVYAMLSFATPADRRDLALGMAAVYAQQGLPCQLAQCTV